MHTCKALVIHCMDFRFIESLRQWLNSVGLKNDYDLVSVAGAAKNIVSPSQSSDRDFLLRQIETSKRLHHISEVYLINHLDCGAYGGAKAFSDQNAERNQHVSDLKAAKEILQKQFSDLAVKLVVAKLAKDTGEFEVQFEMIV